jgi:hypothetical protein
MVACTDLKIAFGWEKVEIFVTFVSRIEFLAVERHKK